MAKNYFTAAQAREAAEKKEWRNLCEAVNQFIIKAYEKGEYSTIVRVNDLTKERKTRMVIWLEELGYVAVYVLTNDIYVCWKRPTPIDEEKYPKHENLIPLRATDAKKYSDEYSMRELTLKEILDKVRELADAGIYRHTFPLASFCEHNAIRPSTIDRLQELGYEVCVKCDRLEVIWNKINRSEKNDKSLLTAWDALLRADTYNYKVAAQIGMVLNAIHDKSTNEGLFEHIAYVSCPETCVKLRALGYKVTELPTELSGYKIKIYWGE